MPDRAVHLAVVDPGVGGPRRPVALRSRGDQLFVGPDNGLLTLAADAGGGVSDAHLLTNEELWLSPLSATFHGRDIFAPLAAQLLNGLPPDNLGPQPDTYTLLDLPLPRETPAEVVGQVLYVDPFGNLVSNIPAEMLRDRWPELQAVRVWCAGREVGPLQPAYGFVQPGQPVAVVNSMDVVEVGVNRGRAAETLNAGVGAVVRVAG